MRVVIVSQFYPPEPGATQNRVAAFAEGLAGRGHDVTVICEQPNHPAGKFHTGYGRRPLVSEASNGVRARRLWVMTSPDKTTVRRLAFYGTFAAGALIAVSAERRPDVIFASSPPLPGALAAGVVARARRIPFVLDVRDIWPAAAEALGELSSRRVLSALERSERWLYQSSIHVTTTTRPFCAHIDRTAQRSLAVHVPNGALDALLALPAADPPDDGTFVVGYAGNFGIAQGLRIVLDAAERLRGEDISFVLIGDGPIASELRAERARRRLAHVQIKPSVPVTQVGAAMQACHAMLVPLRDHPLLADFVPSKLYDAMAVGRPVIVAANGESARIVRELRTGIAVAPEDGDALAAAVRMLASDRSLARTLGAAGRRAAIVNARSRQVRRLEEILLDASKQQTARAPNLAGVGSRQR
jgi:glycosyltransferase involved in cell wall biosynthesis